jgi:hypothetical protein
MPKPGERTRIAMLIVVAVLAIACAMFEALASEPGISLLASGAGVPRP